MDTFPKDIFPDPDERERQRLHNAARWQELAERYGTTGSAHNPYLIAEDETAWIQQLEQLDQQIAHPTYLTVHTRLGYPIVKALAEINPDDLAEELDTLLEFMYLNGIAVDFLCDVADEEAYRFIVEELFDEKTDDMRDTGMTTHFIYEEFHPNAEYDAKLWADSFVRSLLHHHREGIELALHDEELYDRNGAPTTRGAILRRVDAFFERYPTITDSTIEVLSCRLDGDYADVELATTWTTVQTQPSDLLKTVGRSYLRMKRTSDDYWEVIQARIAGWD